MPTIDKRKHILHGDIGLHPVQMKSPKTFKVKKIHVLESSNVTGNRHEVYGEAIIRWTTGEKEYIASKKPFHIRHIGGDAEHGVQDIEAGTYEVRHELEYDPWKNELRAIID